MSYESFETIKVSIDGAIATLTINREAARNALSSQVIAELTHIAGEIEISSDVRVVILTCAGDKAFVAGADIAEMVEMTPMQAQAFAEMVAHSHRDRDHLEGVDRTFMASLSAALRARARCDSTRASKLISASPIEPALSGLGARAPPARVGVAKRRSVHTAT